MRNINNLSFKSNLLKSSAKSSRFGNDIKGANMNFNTQKFNFKKDSENDSFERFSHQLDDRDEQFNQIRVSKFQKSPRTNKASMTKRKTDQEQKVKNRRFFLEDVKGLYKDKDISDYSEEYLSSSSSFDNDDVKNVLGNKVENAVYEIYGKNIPKSAIKELKESISFVLKEQADQLPKHSDDEYLDQETGYSEYGSEYSDTEDDYQYDYEYDQIKENESENLKLEKLQIISEKRMRMMQEQQYQIQVFQYGLTLDKKPIRIYQKGDRKASTSKKRSKLISTRSNQAATSKKNDQNEANNNNKDETTPNQSESIELKIVIEDFNKLSLKSQHDKIQKVVESNINPRLKSKLNDLNILIEYLMNLQNISETKNYLTVEKEEDNDQYFNQKTNNICLCYDMTQILYENKLLNSPDFINLLSKFNSSVEIKYPSDNFKEIYQILNSNKIKFNAVISGIAKTDKTFMKNKNMISVTIESSVKMIDVSSFQGCSSLKKAIIPSSVTLIGANAFCECKSLKEINIPDSVTSIGEFAFCECGLTKIVIPSSIKSINIATFRECESLSQVTIPSSVNSIGNYAFFLCGSLEKIDIPSSVTSIGRSSFEGSPSSSMIPSSLIKASSSKNTSKWKSNTKSQWMPITKVKSPTDDGWTGPNQNNLDLEEIRWGVPSGTNAGFMQSNQQGNGTNWNMPKSVVSSIWSSNSKSKENEKDTSNPDSNATKNSSSNSTQPTSNQSNELKPSVTTSSNSNEGTGRGPSDSIQLLKWGISNSNQSNAWAKSNSNQGDTSKEFSGSNQRSNWSTESWVKQDTPWGSKNQNQGSTWK